MLDFVKTFNERLRLRYRIPHQVVLLSVLRQAQSSCVVAVPRLEALSPDLNEVIRVVLFRVNVRNHIVVREVCSSSCIDLRVVVDEFVTEN